MREEVEAQLQCKQENLCIVYEFNGDKSSDVVVSSGETPNWSQRYNPFLGKGFDGQCVLDCIASLAHVHTWYAEVSLSLPSSPTDVLGPRGVMFSLFNAAQYSTALNIKDTIAAAYRRLSRCAGGSTVHFQHEVDLSFCIGSVSFASLWGTAAVQESSRQHLFCGAYMFITPGTPGPLDCCEMHRCVAYVSSPTVQSASVVKPYWFYAPLTWLDAACGVHDDEFYFTDRGERFKALVPSALTDLEAAVTYASQFRCGSDAHLRIVQAFRKAPTSCLQSFFGAKAYYLTTLGSLFFAWTNKNNTRENIAEMVTALTDLVTFIPAARFQLVLYDMYTRFETEWERQCSTVQVLTTAILLLSVRFQNQVLAETVAVLEKGHCLSPDVQKLVQDFLGNDKHALTQTVHGVETRLLALNDAYISSETWWYSVVVQNIEDMLREQHRGKDHVQGHGTELALQLEKATRCTACIAAGSNSEIHVRRQRPIEVCENFGCVVRNWRAFIDEPQVLSRFDVFVKAMGLGANPFWYFQVPARCLKSPVHSIDPLELIVVCAIACTSMERCRVFWKTYSSGASKNVRAFAACLNNWSPLRVGYQYALKALQAVCICDEEFESDGLLSELHSELHGRWQNVLAEKATTNN